MDKLFIGKLFIPKLFIGKLFIRKLFIDIPFIGTLFIRKFFVTFQAMKCLERALEMKEFVLETNDSWIAQSLHYLGDLYLLLGNLEYERMLLHIFCL